MTTRRASIGLVVAVCLVTSGLVACGGGSAHGETPAVASTSGAEDQDVSASADAELEGLPAPAVVEEGPAPRQGDVIDAGVIARAQLQAVISAGIPTFLQHVRTEPHKDGNRFIGWRLLSVFDDPAFALGPLRLGDTVLGVNGRTIERPEQFFAVWESLPSATQLTFQVLRAGQAYEVRYAVQD